MRTAPTVLVVDDDVDFRKSVCTTLGEEGYLTREAADGASAVNALASRRPDLILLDLMMPSGNGWEVLESLRSSGETDRIPVVVISAYASSIPTGARALLQKPVNRDDLVSTVREHLAG